MREIKFRGKRVETGEWIVGFFIRLDSELNKDYIFNGVRPIEVVRCSVGQFTGLKDKNGNDIYE